MFKIETRFNIICTERATQTRYKTKQSLLYLLTVNLPKRLEGINIFFQFSWAKNGDFLTFNVIKNFKMRVVLEIRVLLEGESY